MAQFPNLTTHRQAASRGGVYEDQHLAYKLRAPWSPSQMQSSV